MKIKRNGKIIECVPILYNLDERKLKVKGKGSGGQDFVERFKEKIV